MCGGLPSFGLQYLCPRGLRLIVPHDQALNLERIFCHRIKFSLASDVGMYVLVNSLAPLNVTDLSFRDLFSGLTIVKGSGDY